MRKSNSRIRVAVGGFGAESNSFSLEKPGKDSAIVTTPAGLVAANQGKRTVIGGFLEALGSENVDILALPKVWWGATGVITKDGYDYFKEVVLKSIRDQGGVDAVLLDLHGAMLAEGIPDAEGVLLKEIRDVVGRDALIVSVVDLHANMTDLKLATCDLILPYKTNPHIDLYERGLKAGRMLLDMLDGKVRPLMHLERLPILGNNLGMSTWSYDLELQSRLPLARIMARTAELEEEEEKVLDVSVIIGFGQADIPECVTSVLAITNADAEMARAAAVEIATSVWNARDEFFKIRPLVSVDEAVDRAMDAPDGPVILVDVGDNAGGGAPCDNTVILEALLRKGARSAVVPLRDPEAVSRSLEAGVGSTIELEVGGKMDSRFYGPVKIKAKVKTLSDGSYTIRGPSHGGHGERWGAWTEAWRETDAGRMALLATGTVEVIVCEGKVGMERDFYKAVGVDPAERKIVVVKSHQAHRASFEPIAKMIIEVDTPGITSPLYRGMPMKNAPSGAYLVGQGNQWSSQRTT